MEQFPPLVTRALAAARHLRNSLLVGTRTK